MKLREWFKVRSAQEWLMIAVIAMLIIMIATRWGDIARHTGAAFKQRFVPSQEQPDSTTHKVNER